MSKYPNCPQCAIVNHVKLSNCQNIKISRCQIGKMSNWQNVKLAIKLSQYCPPGICPTKNWLLAFVRPKIASRHLSANLGSYIPIVILDQVITILSNFSMLRGVAILDCESHSQAGSTTLGPQYKTSRFLAIYCPTSKSQGWSSINIAQLRDAKGRHHSWKKDFFWNHFIKWWPPPVPLLWSPYLFIFSSTFWAKKIDDFEGCLKGVVDGCFKGVWSVFGKIK